MPIGDEAVRGPVRHLLQGQLDIAAASGGAQQRADDIITVGAAQIRPERLAPAVREPAGVLQIPEAGELATPYGISHPHRGIRVDVAERHVLRHTLDEPQRHAVQARRQIAPTDARDVVLERVRQLVADDVVGLGERCAHGQNDAALQTLGDAASAFTGLLAQHVGLLEIGMIGVENQRLPAVELMA